MFTRRHDQELAEIKALTYELGSRVQEVQEQLGRIQDAQQQVAQDPPVGAVGAKAVDVQPRAPEATPEPQVLAPTKKARKAKAPPDELDVETPAPEAVGAKKGKKGKGGKKGRERQRPDPAARKRRRREAADFPDSGEE